VSSVAFLLLSKLMEFTERDYLEEEVRVEVTGRSVKVPLHEGITELSRGAEYIIPRWLALALEKDGVVRIRGEELSIEKLSSIVYNEEALVKKLQLTKLPRFFYLLNKKYIDALKEKLTASADISLLEEYKHREDLFFTIARLRVKKLLNFILLAGLPQEIADKLSEEEKMLYNSLKSVLDSWMKSLGLEKA